MTSDNSICDLVQHVSKELLKMRPDQIARLRRMQNNGPGVLEYWQVIVSTESDSSDHVIQLVKTMAILTPQGPPNGINKLHLKQNTLGRILCRVNYPETQLMRLIEVPHHGRSEAIERAARWISNRHTEGINCFDIACLLLSEDVKHTRRLAEDYYKQKYQKHSTEVSR